MLMIYPDARQVFSTCRAFLFATLKRRWSAAPLLALFTLGYSALVAGAAGTVALGITALKLLIETVLTIWAAVKAGKTKDKNARQHRQARRDAKPSRSQHRQQQADGPFGRTWNDGFAETPGWSMMSDSLAFKGSPVVMLLLL